MTFKPKVHPTGPRKAWTPHGTCHHKLYKLSCNQWAALYERSKGVCEVCGGPPVTKSGLHIDHDHALGYVRGLVCPPCNRQLGMVDTGKRPATPEERAYLEAPFWVIQDGAA